MMKILISILLSLLAILPTIAQETVPVAREPRHHFKFENEFVRVFDVIVPPGDGTLFHTHANDYLFVSIGDANLKAEVLGNAPGDLILKDGEVRFTKGPITHRVTNQSSSDFRNITIEVLKSPMPDKSPTEPDKPIAGHTLMLENDRVRVERLVLDPGHSTGMHSHTLPGLVVAVSSGEIEAEAPGQAGQTVKFAPGDFRWREGRVTHKLTNVGKTRFEAIDIDWKRKGR